MSQRSNEELLEERIFSIRKTLNQLNVEVAESSKDASPLQEFLEERYLEPKVTDLDSPQNYSKTYSESSKV